MVFSHFLAHFKEDFVLVAFVTVYVLLGTFFDFHNFFIDCIHF